MLSHNSYNADDSTVQFPAGSKIYKQKVDVGKCTVVFIFSGMQYCTWDIWQCDQAVNEDGSDTFFRCELGMIMWGRRLDLLTQRGWQVVKTERRPTLKHNVQFFFFFSEKVKTQAGSSLILELPECIGWHKVSILFPLPIAMRENWFNIWHLRQMHPCGGTKYAHSMCLAKLKHLRFQEFQLFTIKWDIIVDVREDIFKECTEVAFTLQAVEQYGECSTNA